jgi:hypothetical protein
MSIPHDSQPNVPLAKTIRWLRAHAGFPCSRLDTRAEILICVAALAEAETPLPAGGFQLQRRIVPEGAALRSHALRRSHAQFKSDNSSKV